MQEGSGKTAGAIPCPQAQSIAPAVDEVNMRFLTFAFLLAALPLPGGRPAHAADGYAPLRPLSACLAPDRARSWHLIDGSRLLVDTGRRHFLLELSWSCNELATHRAITFISRNPGNRICGDIGDAVQPREGGNGVLARCDISRVTPLSRDEAAAELRATETRGEVRLQRSSSD